MSLHGTYGDGQSFSADFITHFDVTGGFERWGYPISEVFEERPGLLVQYFSNGVLDYQPYKRNATSRFQWRPVWDLLDRSRYVEGCEELTNSNDGEIIGPNGMMVSNISVEGAEVGFLDAYNRLGGRDTFGHPKTVARSDMHPEAKLSVDTSPTDFVRQYFQVAVLEDFGDASTSPVLRRLGEDLRDQNYPEGSWMSLTVFRRAGVLQAGQAFPPEYLGHYVAELRDAPDDGAVLVGRASHPYAIAYHPQRHLLYRDGDGWYAFFYDGTHGVVSYSKDGVEFSPPQIVTHDRSEKGVSVYEVGGELYFLYTDSNSMKVFLLPAKVEGGRVQADDPILVWDWGVSYSASFPNLTIGPAGRPWIVTRSYSSTPTGALVDIWLTHAEDMSMQTWATPVKISSPEEAPLGGAGTSGSLAFAGEDLMVVFDIYFTGGRSDGEMVGYSSEGGSIENFVREPAGSFRGTHDFIILESRGKAHLAYHRAISLQAGQMMTYQTWTREDSWSQPLDVGETSTHSTAMSIDNDGNVWIFYRDGPDERKIQFRVLENESEAFGPVRCAAFIPELRLAGSAWLASSQPSGNEVGLLWMEKPADFWEVKFRSLSLNDVSRDAHCDG